MPAAFTAVAIPKRRRLGLQARRRRERAGIVEGVVAKQRPAEIEADDLSCLERIDDQ